MHAPRSKNVFDLVRSEPASCSAQLRVHWCRREVTVDTEDKTLLGEGAMYSILSTGAKYAYMCVNGFFSCKVPHIRSLEAM